MRTEHQSGTDWHVGQIFDKYGTFLAQVINDKLIVDDFVAHINWPTVLLQRALDDFDGTINAGAKATGVCKQDFGFTHLASTCIRRMEC